MAYPLIFRQCTDHMHSTLEEHKDYRIIMGDYDMPILVGAIKGPTFKFGRYKHLPHALHESKKDLYRYYHTGTTTDL